VTAGFALTGGCQCGAVRYRVTARAREVYHCHCSMCRRIHVSVFASFAIVGRDRFIIEHGEELLGRYDSSSSAYRCFCTRCGSQIYSDVQKWPDIRFYTVGTLDEGAHPGHEAANERHIYVGSKLPWWHIADDLPQIEES
jgi:hypothetical protein